MAAATELGIVVSGTVSGSNKSEGTVEQTWALILALSRRLILEHDGVRNGAWQTGVATGLSGKQLGLVGVGRLGQAVARIGVAFGLDVVGWSPNLTEERAREAGVELAPSLDYLLSSSDIVSIHIVEAPSTIGLIGASQLALLKPAAFLVNTSRGPIVDEEALIDALEKRSFGGAGLDVFAQEPLPLNHRLRQLDNVVLSPHMGELAPPMVLLLFSYICVDILWSAGYVDEASYGPWWEQTPKNFAAFLAGEPLRVLSG